MICIKCYTTSYRLYSKIINTKIFCSNKYFTLLNVWLQMQYTAYIYVRARSHTHTWDQMYTQHCLSWIQLTALFRLSFAKRLAPDPALPLIHEYSLLCNAFTPGTSMCSCPSTSLRLSQEHSFSRVLKSSSNHFNLFLNSFHNCLSNVLDSYIN